MVRALLVALAALVAVLVLRALAADEAAGAPAGTPSQPDAAVGDLGLTPDRTLEVPDDVRATGWWSGGTPPGSGQPRWRLGSGVDMSRET